MDLKSAPRFPGAPYRRSHLFERHRPLCEVEYVGTHSSKTYSRCHTAVASACRVVRYEATVRTRKREDRVSGTLESLAQHTWIDTKRLGGLGPWKVENLPKDVGQPVRPVKALEHR